MHKSSLNNFHITLLGDLQECKYIHCHWINFEKLWGMETNVCQPSHIVCIWWSRFYRINLRFYFIVDFLTSKSHYISICWRDKFYFLCFCLCYISSDEQYFREIPNLFVGSTHTILHIDHKFICENVWTSISWLCYQENKLKRSSEQMS